MTAYNISLLVLLQKASCSINRNPYRVVFIFQHNHHKVVKVLASDETALAERSSRDNSGSSSDETSDEL